MLLTDGQLRKAVAEGIGTFVIVFAGCGSIMVAERFPGTVTAGAVPVIFGLAVTSMIYALGHISGAHFNPAVTLAFAIARHFPKREVVAYWAAQFTGAALAIALLHVILPAGEHYGATISRLAVTQALVWEAVITFCLMFVIISVATDTRAEGTMAGIAIGAVVALAAFVAGPLTGASMNPARSIAPAIAEGHFDQLWIYFVGPVVGASLAAVTYQWLRCETVSRQKNAKGCC